MLGMLVLVGWFFSLKLTPNVGITEGSPLPEGTTQPQLIIVNDDALMLAPNGALYRWGGKSTTTKTPGAIKPDLRFRKTAMHHGAILAVHEDGTIWGWGNNSFLIPNNPDIAPQEARRLFPDTGFIDISMSNRHALALKEDGTIWSWGKNENGQMGTGRNPDSNEPSPASSEVPLQIGSETDWTSIHASSTLSYGIKQDGRILRWGKRPVVGSGPGTSPRWTPIQTLIEQAKVVYHPEAFTDIEGWKQVVALQYVTILLHKDGSLWLDTPPPRTQAWMPYSQTEPSGLGLLEIGMDFTQFVASEHFILAQQKNGSWWGIGNNILNQMGLIHDTSMGSSFAPLTEWEPLPHSFDPWAIGSDIQATLVLTRDGQLWSTGSIIGESLKTPFWNKIASWVNNNPLFISLPSHLPNHYSGFHHIWTWQPEKSSNANSH